MERPPLRRAEARGRAGFSPPRKAAAGPPLDELWRAGRSSETAIRTLKPAYWEVLQSNDVVGLTAPRVAEVLGLRVEAVKSRLHRARAEVRERLQPFLEAGAAPPSPECPDIAARLSRYLEGEISRGTCVRSGIRRLAATS